MSVLVCDQEHPPVVYHGTRAGRIERFKPRFRRGEQLGFGIHFAFDEAFARHYADNPGVARRGKHPVVIAARVEAANPLVADRIVWEDETDFALAYQLAGKRMPYPKGLDGRCGCYLQNAIDVTSPQRAQRLIEAAGFDAVIYKARLSAPAIGGYHKLCESRSITVFSPDQIHVLPVRRVPRSGRAQPVYESPSP